MGQHLKQNVEGQQSVVSNEFLGELVDLARLKKIYKLNTAQKKGTAKGASADSVERDEMETLVLGTMALKGS